MSNRVLVTGANGFLGGHLIEALLKAGVPVRAFVRRPPAEPWLRRKSVEVHIGDLADAAAVERAVRGAATVYHVGATMSGAPEDYDQGTIRGTRNIVHACLSQQARRLVYVSSVSVYDYASLPGDGPITENWRLDPHPERRGDYARSKIAAEHIVSIAAVNRGLPAVIVRPGLIYGPRGPVLLSDVGKALAGPFVMLTGSAGFRLPLAYVTNVVDALMKAADYGGPAGEAFHVVDDETLTRREYLRRVRLATGRRFVGLPVPAPLLMAVALACESLWPIIGRGSSAPPLTRYRTHAATTARGFDTDKARTLLGWAPRIGIDQALKETWRTPLHVSPELT